MTRQVVLDLDEELLERAEDLSKKSGKSVSQIVGELLEGLPEGRSTATNLEPPSLEALDLPPITRSLVGILKGTGADEEDYHRYLEERYR